MEISLLQSIVLGIVQGVTEFLPISSSGHLVMVQYFFGIDEPRITFVIAVHVGSLLAVLIYFWRDWLNIFHVKKDMEVYQKNPRLLIWIVLATLPAAVIGLIINEHVESIVFSQVTIALFVLIGSVFLYITDRFGRRNESMQSVDMKRSLGIGFLQILALVPGISRSGVTIAGARMWGMNRVDAARFSFLIAAPIIAGASFLQIREIVFSHITVTVIIGMLTAFFSAMITIHYFLALISKISYAVFLYYAIGFFVIVGILFYL